MDCKYRFILMILLHVFETAYKKLTFSIDVGFFGLPVRQDHLSVLHEHKVTNELHGRNQDFAKKELGGLKVINFCNVNLIIILGNAI